MVESGGGGVGVEMLTAEVGVGAEVLAAGLGAGAGVLAAGGGVVVAGGGGFTQVHALGGPSVDPSERAHEANQAVAP